MSDAAYYTGQTAETGIEFKRNDVRDFSKLKLVDGRIDFFMYGQNGNKVPMAIPDTLSNRLLVSWIQIHDRWTGVRP